jgi:hypothetical protein
MANKKIIAFSIEIDGKKEIKEVTQLFALLEKQIKGVNKELDELNKKTKKIGSDGLKEADKALKNTGTSAKRLTNTFKQSFQSFDQGNKTVKDLGNGYFEVTKAIDKASSEVRENADSISDLIKRNKTLKKVLSETKQGVKEVDFNGQTVEVSKLTKEYSRNNDAIKQFRTELRTGTKAQDIAKDSILDLRKRVTNLKKEYLGLTPAQQKFTLSGRKTRRELIKLTKTLKKQEEQIGDFRRSVGNYEKALKRVGRSALKVFGIRGAFEGLRRVGQGLTSLVEKGKETNETFANISKAAAGLSNAATNIGTNLLSTFGDTIQGALESVSFVISKVSEAFTNLANSGGLVGKVFSFIGLIIKDFPSVLGGVRAVFGEFFAKIGRGFDNASLKAQELFLNVRRIASAITGEDVGAIDKRLGEITKRLEENKNAAVSFTDAFNEGFKAVKDEQDAFIKRNNEEIEARARAEKAIAAAQEAGKANAEAETARLDELSKEREALNKKLIEDEIARLQIIKGLTEQLKDSQIENIKDEGEKAIQAENERFKREQENRKNNFKKLEDQIKEQRAELIRLNEGNAEKLKEFDLKTGEDLRKVNEINNKLELEQQEAHEKTLTSIREKGAQDRTKATKTAFSNLSSALTKGLEKTVQAAQEVTEKAEETRKEQLEATKDALITAVNGLLDGISQIATIAAEAENQRFENAISERQNNIDKLNEDLADATGLQKKFLEQQIEQEKKAQEQLNKQAEKARKEQAEAQKAIAIVQAVISTALAVVNALGSAPPPASFILAAAAGVAGAVQIATIASQKFALGGIAEDGGIISGPSHNEGGVPFTIGKKSGFEAEGGEAIINKKSTALYKPLLSKINQAGGGVAFAGGGVLSAPVVANEANANFDAMLKAFEGQTAAINNRIDNIKVINSIDDFNEVSEQETILDAESTL